MTLLRGALAALCCALLGACGTLPDAKPFADASNAMALSVQASGQAASDSLRDAALLAPSSEARLYQDAAAQLDQAWAQRVQAAQGAAAYAQAVSDLIAAGNSGADTAKQLGDRLEQLAGAAGIPLAAPAVGAAGDLARFILSRAAMVRASQQLELAVQQAQPAVDRIAAHLAQESAGQLQPILQAASKNAASALRQQYDDDDNYVPLLKRRVAVARQDALRDAANIPVQLQLEQIQAGVSVRLAERDQKLAQAAAAYRARSALIAAMADAVAAWAAAHRDLAVAIRDKRRVSVAELQSSVTELKALAKKVREL